MNRENVLFLVIGLLLGYVAAFHLVVYVNKNMSEEAAASVSATGLPSAQPANDVKERQRLQSAAETAARAAREDAQNFDAQLKAANAQLDAREFEEAIDFLTRANQLRPEDYDTLVKLGHANTAARRFDTAAQWFKAALAKRPDDGDVRSELALTYFFRNPPQHAEAIAELREALKRDPAHLASLHNLALMFIETRDLEEAAATLERLERADPSYPQLPRLRDELDKARDAESETSPGPAGGSKKSPAVKSPAD